MSDNGYDDDLLGEIAWRERRRDYLASEYQRLGQELADLRQRERAGEGMTSEQRRALMRQRTAEIAKRVLGATGILLVLDWLRRRPAVSAAAVATTAAVVYGTAIAPDPGETPFLADPPREAEILLPDREPPSSPPPSFDRTLPPTLVPSDPGFTPSPTSTLPTTGEPTTTTPTSTPTPTDTRPSPPRTRTPSPTPPRTTPPPSPSPTPTRPPTTPPPSPTPSPTPTPTATPDWLLCVDLPPLLRDLCLVELGDGEVISHAPAAGRRATDV